MMLQPRIRHRTHTPRVLLIQLRMAGRQDGAHGPDDRAGVVREGVLGCRLGGEGGAFGGVAGEGRVRGDGGGGWVRVD